MSPALIEEKTGGICAANERERESGVIEIDAPSHLIEISVFCCV